MSSEPVPTASAGSGWWAPRAVVSDVLLAAAVLFVEVGPVVGRAPPWNLRPFGLNDAFALAAMLAGLLLRRRFPGAGLALVIGSMTIAPFLGLGLLVSFYSVGAWSGSDNRSAVVAAAGATVAIASVVVTRNVALPFEAAIGVAAFGIAWYLGLLSKVRRRYTAVLEERAHRLEAERQAERRRAAAEERTRIARELHDIVAHRVSMMTVQAGAAGVVARSDPEAAREAIGAVEKAGREALSELRHLVSVLRTDDDGTDPLDPDNRLTDLTSLVDGFRRAGVPVDLEVTGIPQRLDEGLEACSYRIVQEALTNVLRHAGPQAEARVVVRYEPDELRLEVTDTGAGPQRKPDEIGYGIIGMEERAAAFGGRVETGPGQGGGFVVRARIPLEGAAP